MAYLSEHMADVHGKYLQLKAEAGLVGRRHRRHILSFCSTKNLASCNAKTIFMRLTTFPLIMRDSKSPVILARNRKQILTPILGRSRAFGLLKNSLISIFASLAISFLKGASFKGVRGGCQFHLLNVWFSTENDLQVWSHCPTIAHEHLSWSVWESRRNPCRPLFFN